MTALQFATYADGSTASHAARLSLFSSHNETTAARFITLKSSGGGVSPRWHSFGSVEALPGFKRIGGAMGWRVLGAVVTGGKALRGPIGWCDFR
jgi:hypothetical protein